MHKYLGNLDQLKFMVGALGFRGAWTEIPNGHQFRAENGAILNCFSNGTLQFQGLRGFKWVLLR